jgi:hypothetical protein
MVTTTQRLYTAIVCNEKLDFESLLFAPFKAYRAVCMGGSAPLRTNIPIDVLYDGKYMIAHAIENDRHYFAQILLKLGAIVPREFDTNPCMINDVDTLHALLLSTDPSFSAERKRIFVQCALQYALITNNCLAVKRLLREESVDYGWVKDVLQEIRDELDHNIVYLIEETLLLKNVHAAVLEENVPNLCIALKKIHWRGIYSTLIAGVTAIDVWFMHGKNVDILRLLVAAHWTTSFSYKPLLQYRLRRGDLDTVTVILERAIVNHSARTMRKFKLAAEVFLFSGALPPVLTLHVMTFCSVFWF